MKATNGNKYPVKSVVKTLTILEHLGRSPNGTSLTEISTKLRLGKSTVHRLLATLRDHDFVRSEEHTSELQSQFHLVCRLLLEKKKKKITTCNDQTERM